MRINKRPWERKSLQCLYNVARSDNTVKSKTAPTVARWHYVVRGDIWYDKTSEHLLNLSLPKRRKNAEAILEISEQFIYGHVRYTAASFCKKVKTQ
jgi:hypothetical protein